MELISVRCNHCGAPLQIPAEARFVTCMYCKSELTVQRTEGSICTEVLQGISEKTDRIVDNLGVLRAQGELELLDREWQMKRETMMIRNRRGEMVEPGGISILQGCVFVFFVLPFLGAFGSSAFSSKGGIAPMILLWVIVLAVTTIMKREKRSRYRTALAEYEQRRAALMQKLAEQSQAG